MCSIDLKSTIESKKIVQVRHTIDYMAFDINRSGMTATVTVDGEACQAVGVSDKIILLGSTFRLAVGPQIQKITMMRRSGHRRLSNIKISRQQAYIHSIIFVERRGVQFAVVVNFIVDYHLLAVRHDSLQVVQQGVAVCSAYVNAYCVYGEAVIVVGQNTMQKVAKLGVVF